MECSGIKSWESRECQPSFGFVKTPILLGRMWTSNTHQVLVEMIRARAWVSAVGGWHLGMDATPSGWPQLFYLYAQHLLEDCWHRSLGGWDSLCPRDSPLLQVRDWCRIEHCGIWFLFLLNWRVFLYLAQVLFLKEGIAHRTSGTLWQHRDFCKALHKAVPCTYCPRMSSSGLQSHAAQCAGFFSEG